MKTLHTTVRGAAGILGLACLGSPATAHPAATADGVITRLMAQENAARGEVAAIANIGGRLTASEQSRMTAVGASVTSRLPMIDSVAVRLPARNLAKFAALPFVRHLSSDGVVKKFDEFTVASSGAGAAAQQYGVTGQGVTVAVLDSGINGCDDLIGATGSSVWRIAASVSCLTYRPDRDECGHGTHVAGIIAGNGLDSTGPNYTHHFYGIAPKSTLVNVRVLDQNGQGDVGTIVSGIQWVIDHQAQYHIKVLNLSLGHPVGESYTTDPLCQAVEKAWKAGIVVVCAAGNAGRANGAQSAGTANEGWGTAYGSIQSPANDPYVITVGATKNTDGNRAHDQIATYSSRGPSRLDLVCKPDILAPGNRVISTTTCSTVLFGAYSGTNQVRQSSYSNSQVPLLSMSYFTLSGTSMAAPVVAGAAALMLQKDPTLTPDTIKARLMISADKWAAPNGVPDLCTYGAGYLDIPQALACTVRATAPALSPQLTRDADGGLFLNTSSLCGANHVIWGSVANLNVIWGSNVVWGTNVVWGSHVVWGSSVWADHVIWGSTTSAADLSGTALEGE